MSVRLWFRVVVLGIPEPPPATDRKERFERVLEVRGGRVDYTKRKVVPSAAKNRIVRFRLQKQRVGDGAKRS